MECACNENWRKQPGHRNYAIPRLPGDAL